MLNTQSVQFGLLIFLWIVSTSTIFGNHYDLLGVSKIADSKEIKKSYRKLALELHPDKLMQQNYTTEEIENKTDHFILVQEAYETLVDERKRFLYDSTLSGVNTDIITEPTESFKMFPFNLLVRTRRLTLEVNALFPQPSVPDIEIDIKLSVATVFTGKTGNHSYFRQLECPSCKGNGGNNGSCRTCTFCEGKGHAKHLLRDKNMSYLHISSTTCHSCKGKGVHPIGTCNQCKGRGFILQEEMVFYELPVGWHNLYKLKYIGKGHQRKVGGEIGGMMLTFHHDLPHGWSFAEGGDIGDMQLELNIPVKRYIEGFNEKIALLDGRVTEVRVDKVTDVTNVTELTFLKKHCGIPKEIFPSYNNDTPLKKEQLGDLYVTITPEWVDTPASVWEYFLKEMIRNDNSTESYDKMMNLYKLFGMKKAQKEKAKRDNINDESDVTVTLEDIK